MEDPILWPILLQIVLIALNAIFACAEIAIISINDNKLAQLVSQGDKRAVRLARLTSRPAQFLATIQIAITLSGFLGSAFAADNFSDPLVAMLVDAGVPIPAKTLNTIAVVVITLVLSYITLVFGELVPKRLAMKKADTLALGLSGLISTLSTICAPVVAVLTASTNGILRLLGVDPSADEDEVSEEEIKMMVDRGNEKGVFDSATKEFIQNVFEFDDLTVGEFATHRTELDLLWTAQTTEEWRQIIFETRHTRYPVCDGSVDRVVGILDSRDFFRMQDRPLEDFGQRGKARLLCPGNHQGGRALPTDEAAAHLLRRGAGRVRRLLRGGHPEGPAGAAGGRVPARGGTAGDPGPGQRHLAHPRLRPPGRRGPRAGSGTARGGVRHLRRVCV